MGNLLIGSAAAIFSLVALFGLLLAVAGFEAAADIDESWGAFGLVGLGVSVVFGILALWFWRALFRKISNDFNIWGW